MKSVKRNIITLIAPLAFLALGSIANATGTTTTYASDDLFIGFHSSTSNSDVLVKIGQASTFTSTKDLSLGNIAADLSYALGSGWATDPNVSWGVIGTTRLTAVSPDPIHTVYASKQGNLSTITAWSTASSSALGSCDSRIDPMAQAYKGKTSTANSTVAIIQTSVSTSTNNAYAAYQPNGALATGSAANLSFAFFNPTIEASGPSGITASTSTLVLYRMTPSVTPTAVGTFSINSSGTVHFIVAPSSPYNTWATSHSLTGANALPTATPANDGIQNMVKFVLDADPNSGTAQNTPTGVISGSNLVYSFHFNTASTTEYTTAVEYSTDLATWHTATGGSLSGSTYSYTIPRAGATNFFTRLRVTQN